MQTRQVQVQRHKIKITNPSYSHAHPGHTNDASIITIYGQNA